MKIEASADVHATCVAYIPVIAQAVLSPSWPCAAARLLPGWPGRGALPCLGCPGPGCTGSAGGAAAEPHLERLPTESAAAVTHPCTMQTC